MAAVNRRTVLSGAIGLAAAAALPRAYAKFATAPIVDGFTGSPNHTAATVMAATGTTLE